MLPNLKCKKLKFIFTGTPCSGTGYVSQMLTDAGMPTGHEMFFGMPGVGFFPKNAVADSSWLAVPLLQHCQETRRIHIVRDPLKTISSMMALRHLEEDKIGVNMFSLYTVVNLPEVMKFKGIDRYLFFWSVWNNVAEKECEKTFRLEDIIKNPKPFFKYLGIEPKGAKPYKEVYNALKSVAYLKKKDLKGCNKSLVQNMEKQAKKYGYTLK